MNSVPQVYQLDFGGRVTQESAKNFQIEYKGKQVKLKRTSVYYWAVNVCSSRSTLDL